MQPPASASVAGGSADLGTPPHAWVTGSSSGIGAAITQRLLDGGWRVQGLDFAAPTIAHPAFISHRVDLSETAPTEALISLLLADGPPQALVHAAGVMRTAALGSLRETEGALMWRLHVEAATRLADAVLPAMAQRGGGRCVLIGSRVSRGLAGRSQYAATKAALVGLVRSWALELGPRGITANVIAPGATDTPFLRDPARAQTAPKMPLIGRLVRPEEVAALAAFLVGPHGGAMTGQHLVMCGGASL